MNKKNWILVGILTLIVTLAIISVFSGKKKTEIVDKIDPTPSRPVENTFSDTGARYISPTDTEYEEITAIAELRKIVPINDNAFTIDFDYKINKFVVKLSQKQEKNKTRFEEWLSGNGYGKISDIYFVIE